MFNAPKPPNFEEIAPQEARRRMEAKPVFILDVREPEEFVSGHIPGAVLIPMGKVIQRSGEIPTDREILVVCHSGSRSRTIALRLASNGYKAANLRGGMFAWERERLPVTKGAK